MCENECNYEDVLYLDCVLDPLCIDVKTEHTPDVLNTHQALYAGVKERELRRGLGRRAVRVALCHVSMNLACCVWLHLIL